tara:strand:+ start:4080 stop:5177 length:1098 start_codon:yes stop_codon:yes gene_type:complete
MIISIGTTNGLKIAIKNTINQTESDLLISKLYEKNIFSPIKIDTNIISQIKKIDGIINFHAVINKPTIISVEDKIEGIIIKGIDTTYKSQLIKNHIITGKYFDKIDKNEIIISENQAKKLKLNVGESCILNFLTQNNNLKKRKFHVCGIFKMENETFNNNYAYSKIESIKKINKWQNNEVSNYEIELNKKSNYNQIIEKINSLIDYDLVVQSMQSRFPSIFNWINLFEKNMFFILTIMSIICLINMTNALLILVLERIKMIGVLKSYGCSNYSILKIFLYNSWKITIKGIIIGNIIGVIICLIQEKTQIIKLDSASYFVNYLPIYLDISLILFMNIITFLIIQISIILPYFIIKNITPSNILKIN